MTVTQLGRWVTAGNNQSHTVKLVSVSGTDISVGSVTVDTFGAPAGQFAYGTLASPVTLSANTTYFVVTREYLNGDQWWDYTSQLSGPGTWTFNYDPAGESSGDGEWYAGDQVRDQPERTALPDIGEDEARREQDLLCVWARVAL
jgi:hypothetical protein